MLKLIANSLYGIFAELNKYEFGKNNAKQLVVFSGEHKFKQKTFTLEKPGRWQFAPAAALITAGGRLVLAILERMVIDRGGTYLLTDTDSMLIVAVKERRKRTMCLSGHQTRSKSPHMGRISRNSARELNRLNPYDKGAVQEILKIEKCNYDQEGNQQQLYGLAVSAKRYVVYTRRSDRLEIVKPSEHGLGVVYVPDERSRYKPVHCQDQKTDYARWIVEVWESLLDGAL